MQLKKYIGLLSVSLLFACTSTESSTDKSHEHGDTLAHTSAESVVPPSFKDANLTPVFAGYINLKDQLVETSFDDARPAAKQLAALLETKDGCENAALIARKIADAKDIATQRAEFTALNTELIPLFKQAELNSGAIYVQHCPMANKGDGGDWLSSAKKIQNPYYGDEMMECGRVLETIEAK